MQRKDADAEDADAEDADPVVEGLNCLAAKTEAGVSINNDLCGHLWLADADTPVPDALWASAREVLGWWLPRFTAEEGADKIRAAIFFIDSRKVPCGGAQQAAAAEAVAAPSIAA